MSSIWQALGVARSQREHLTEQEKVPPAAFPLVTGGTPAQTPLLTPREAALSLQMVSQAI